MRDVVTAEFETLTEELECIRNTDPQSLATMEVGDEWRQGDLRIIRLPDDFVSQHGADIDVSPAVTQLAPGTTQGSRHCLESTGTVSFYRIRNATAVDGPIIHTTQPFSIPHPKHGDCVDIPAGCYAFPGQRAFADELRRVAD